MKSSLMPFAFDDSLVRVHTDEQGNPWFVAKDIARALEYSSTNMPQLLSAVPDEWKGSTQIATLGGEQKMLCLSEQGLYFFVARSDKPKALPFQKWLAGEVLPSIRKTGAYAAPISPPSPLPEMSEAMKRIRPHLRERVLADAIATARITGAATQEEIDTLFQRYCTLIADAPEAGRARLPGMAFADTDVDEKIHRFADECLLRVMGNRISGFDMYDSFRVWWRKQFDAALPPIQRFGTVLGECYPKFRRGGRMYYANVAFTEKGCV